MLQSRSGVANVDLVLTCIHVHGRVAHKRSEGRSTSKGTGVGGPHLHAWARSTEQSETRSSRHGLPCVRAAPCGGGRTGAQLQPHAGQARQAAAGAACGQTHQACGVSATGRAGAGVRTSRREPRPYEIDRFINKILQT